MSLCVRSFSSGTKYVPTFVASAQGCVVRRFNSRQLQPKHVNLPANSPFLNEFLGPNVPLAPLEVRDDSKLTNESNKAHTQINSYCDINQLDNDYYSYNDDPVKKIYTYNDDYDSLSHDIIHVPFLNSTKNDFLVSDNSNLFKNQVHVIGSNNGLGYFNSKTNFEVLDALTKDESQVVFAAKSSSAIKEKPTESASPNKEAPKPEKRLSPDDLEHIYNTLSLDLPRLFVKTMDYSIYHPDVEFINNIRGTTIKGLYPYVKQMSFLRIYGHIKYAYVKLEILKITMHTQDNTIRIRWRINGITNLRILFTFWRFKVWKIKEALKQAESWVDGYSTFYVGNDGLIYKHVADKVMPDDSRDEIESKTSISSKLASQLTGSSVS